MTSAALSSTFFLPGTAGLPAKEKALLDAYKPVPKDIERGVFFHEELHTNYYYSRSKIQKYVVVAIAGMNTQMLLDHEYIKRLNDAGISVMWMALTPRQRGQDSMEDDIRLSRAFMTGNNAPHKILFGLDVPRYAAGYSTGAQIQLKLLHEKDTARKLTSEFSGAAYVSPYLDTAYASRDHAWKIAQKAFRWFKNRYRDIPVTENPIAKVYLAISAAKEGFREVAAVIAPTPRDIDEAEIYGRRLIDNFNPAAASALPSFFIAGQHDPFASRRTTQALVARMHNAEIMVVPGAGHDPIRDKPGCIDILIKKVEECSKARTKMATQYENVAYVPFHTNVPLDKDLLIDYGVSVARRYLGDGLRLAYQSGARALNAATCLL